MAKTGEPATFENYANTFERWFDVRAVRVGDPDERQIAILFSDVTERRNAEERLRISEALARENIERVQLALSAGAIIGTWHWDLPTDRFTVDEAFATVFGLDPRLGREGLSLAQVVTNVHPDDKGGLAHAIDGVIAQSGPFAPPVPGTARRRQLLLDRGQWPGRSRCRRHPAAFSRGAHRRRGAAGDRSRTGQGAGRLAYPQRDPGNPGGRTLGELMQAEEKLRQSQKMEAVASSPAVSPTISTTCWRVSPVPWN